MKKITREDYKSFLLKHGRGTVQPLVEELLRLNIGELVQIEKSEWTNKTPLSTYLGYYKKHLGISFKSKTIGEDGWLFERTS